MNIYLYIKQHSITKLKYFGVTEKDPTSYLGSGTYWKNHIKKHGKQYVKTLKIYTFTNQETCSKFAKEFSDTNNIVESKEWANQITESGTNKFCKNMKMSSTVKRKISIQAKKNHQNGVYDYKHLSNDKSESHKSSISNSLYKWHSNNTHPNLGKFLPPATYERKERISKANRGKIGNRLGKTNSKEHKEKQSIAALNRPRYQCPHCLRDFTIQTYSRYHGDNCKNLLSSTTL